METVTPLTSEDYIRIGARHGSDRIALEADETLAQWERDLPHLASYGQGRRQLDVFRALVERHRQMRTTRPEALAARRETARQLDETIESAWVLAKRIHCLLTPVAREDAACAQRLRAHFPENDLQLDRSLPALGELLMEHGARVDADMRVEEIAVQARELGATLARLRGEKPESAGRPRAETRDIDELDGRLYVMMRDLNRTGRQLVQAGILPARPPFYRFTHLRRAASPAAAPATPAP